jgi:hypothetical protein
MAWLVDYPRILWLFSFVVFWLSAQLGIWLRNRGVTLDEEIRQDFGIVQAATLTLLGLIIGFTFSMATSRYDQRKQYEEEEANAIGTEFVRLDLLPGDSTKLHSLLKQYLNARIQYYITRNSGKLAEIGLTTTRLQNELWTTVVPLAKLQPTPLTALAVSGMNDVLNSQGYTQAAWLNRIPLAAWGLLFFTAICCNMMTGFGVQRARREKYLLLILPMVVSIAFLLIADIDSPRYGIILLKPVNLISLSRSISPQ